MALRFYEQKERRTKRWWPTAASRDACLKLIQPVLGKTVLCLMTPSSFFPCLIYEAYQMIFCFIKTHLLPVTWHDLNLWLFKHTINCVLQTTGVANNSFHSRFTSESEKFTSSLHKNDSLTFHNKQTKNAVMNWRFALPMGNCCCVSHAS